MNWKSAALLLTLAAAAWCESPESLMARAMNELSKPISQETLNRAGAFVKEAIGLWEASSDPKPVSYAQAVLMLGLVASKRPKETEPFLLKAIEVFENNPSSTNPLDLALALELAARSVEPNQANRFKQRAAAIHRQHIDAITKSDPELPSGADEGCTVASPTLISKVEPEYTVGGRLAHQNGTVQLSMVVSSDGIPRKIHLLRSIGFGLDEKAVEAVRQWRFRPAMRDGKPVSCGATIDINFTLF